MVSLGLIWGVVIGPAGGSKNRLVVTNYLIIYMPTPRRWLALTVRALRTARRRSNPSAGSCRPVPTPGTYLFTHTCIGLKAVISTV